MKRQTIQIVVIIWVFLLSACQREEAADVSATGYLVLEDISVVTSEAEAIGAGARTVDADFYVTIASAASTTTYNPGGFPEGKLALEPGTYTLTVENAAYRNGTDNAAKYYYQDTFTIEAEKVTYLQVEVPMVNFAVSFSVPSSFGTYFQRPVFQVKVDYPSSDTPKISTLNSQLVPAYFDYEQGVTLTFTFSALNADNETVALEGTYTAVTSGKMYVVTYSLPEGLSVQ